MIYKSINNITTCISIALKDMKVYIKSMNGDVYPLELEEKTLHSYRYIMSNLVKNYLHLAGNRIKLFKDIVRREDSESQKDDIALNDIENNTFNIKDGDILYMFVLSMRKCIIKKEKNEYTLNIYNEDKELIEAIPVKEIIEKKGKYNKNIEEYVTLIFPYIDFISNIDNKYYIYYE